LLKDSICFKLYGFPDLTVKEKEDSKKMMKQAKTIKQEASTSLLDHDSTGDVSRKQSFESQGNPKEKF